MRVRTLVAAAGVEVRRALAYRVDFWTQAFVVFLVELGLVWFVWTAVYDASGRAEIGDMTRGTAILYYVAVILVGKLVRGNDLADWTVSSDVYEGGLSRDLLYPEPSAAMKYAQQLGSLLPALLQFFLFGAAFPFLLDARGAAITPGTLARGLASIAVANLLYFLMAFCMHCLAFWAENVWSLLVALRLVGNLLGGVMVPLAAWPDATQPWLSALPFRHLFSEPVLTILGRRDAATWATSLGVALAWCVVFAGLARFAFARGRLRYTGPGM
jgi:ABC-type uncharacterized transport system permease subunit